MKPTWGTWGTWGSRGRRALSAVLLLGLGACGGASVDGAAREGAGGDVVYVDVRTPEEFAAGHVEGAINIPHTEMAERWRELEEYRGQDVALYCRSGRRSGIALQVLRERGFETARNAGSLSGLARQGVPVTP